MVRSAAKPRVSGRCFASPGEPCRPRSDLMRPPAIDGPSIHCCYQPNHNNNPGAGNMKKATTIRSVATLAGDAGWRNYHFVKIMTEDGIVGWREYDEGFGAPGVTAAIERLAARVVGKNAFQHERIYAEL